MTNNKISKDQLELINQFSSNLGFENLEEDEKISLNYMFNKEINKYSFPKLLKDYPFVELERGGSTASQVDMQIFFQMTLLKKALKKIANQEIIIQQNKQIIELLTEIKNK